MDDNGKHKPVFKYEEVWNIQGKGGLMKSKYQHSLLFRSRTY